MAIERIGTTAGLKTVYFVNQKGTIVMEATPDHIVNCVDMQDEFIKLLDLAKKELLAFELGKKPAANVITAIEDLLSRVKQ